MFHIILCDDDVDYIEYLKSLILENGLHLEDVLFYEFTSGEELIRNLDSLGACDLLILDMQMKAYDGHQTAGLFRRKFPNSLLVFCSGVRKPTDESFKAMPYRYLLKDYSELKMQSEIFDIIEAIKERKTDRRIVAKSNYNTILINPDDVTYLENYRYGSIIHLYQKKESLQKIISDKKLPDMMSQLTGLGFVYAHNSYIVNLKYVVRLSANGEIMLADGEILTVSRSKLPAFRKEFSSWISRKYG
jgi:hypothetical protein